MLMPAQAAGQAEAQLLGVAVADALLLLAWILFAAIVGLTRLSVRLRVFRFPILLIVLGATLARVAEVAELEQLTLPVTLLFAAGIAFLAARALVIVTFDLIIDRRRRAQTPALIKSLMFGVLVLLCLFIINESLPLSQRVPLGSLLASAAVISVVLGLALQDTLGNLFSGLALHLEHPIKVGHWIRVDDSIGQVVEMDWRSVKLRTLGHDYHVLPNSVVASRLIVNYTDPPTPHRRELLVRAPYNASPDQVSSAVMPALLNRPGIAARPEPVVYLHNFSDHWIDYEVRYWFTNYQQVETLDAEIRRRVWYLFRRTGIASPLPYRDVMLHRARAEPGDKAERIEVMHARMRSIPVFQPLSDEEFRQVLEGMHFALYAAGERIISQGDEGDSFFVVYSGEAEVTVSQAGQRSSVVKLLRPGDYFGEMALLTGERRSATVTALTECGCYVVGSELFEGIIHGNPAIADALSRRLSARRAELLDQIVALETESKQAKKEERHALAERILARIKRYFGLT